MALLAQFFIVHAHGEHVDWRLRRLSPPSLPARCQRPGAPAPHAQALPAQHVWLLGRAADYLLALDAEGQCLLRSRNGAQLGEVVLPLATHGWRCLIHFADCHVDALALLLDGSARPAGGDFQPISPALTRPGGTLQPAAALPYGLFTNSSALPTPGPAPDFDPTTAEAAADIHHLHLGGAIADYRPYLHPSHGLLTFERVTGLPRQAIEMVKLSLDSRGVLHFADACLPLTAETLLATSGEMAGKANTKPNEKPSASPGVHFTDMAQELSGEAAAKARLASVAANETLRYGIAANGSWRRPRPDQPAPLAAADEPPLPGLLPSRPLQLGSYPLMQPPAR